MLGKDYEGQDCSLARTLEAIGERWTLLIIRDAFYGVRRFNDFRDHLDIPKAVLADRLDGLVSDGILERVPDPGHAGRHQYNLTAAGRELWPAMHALLAWGDRHRGPNGRLFLHADCGTPLSDSGACPTCGTTPRPEQVLTRRARPTARTDAVSAALEGPHRLLDPIASHGSAAAGN
jgi:DNA-binding HxlR family transcriptional regulator